MHFQQGPKVILGVFFGSKKAPVPFLGCLFCRWITYKAVARIAWGVPFGTPGETTGALGPQGAEKVQRMLDTTAGFSTKVFEVPIGMAEEMG